MTILRLTAVLALCVFSSCSVQSADGTTDPATAGHRVAYLDECNPWYPHKDFPKLITPQWVGEEGVEAVIVLAIDDMRDPAKYEAYLRPILNRLKQIDGRAPVSIMTNEVKPDDPQLQSWLGEGLSIECHTIDHPCPILQGGDFVKAKSTYDRCVDLMGKIPGNKPAAFRTPCCDSLNTVSPRFFAEIFNRTTDNGNFLQIDSSVFTFFTSEDESLPKELVLDANGKERFWKYLPKNNKYGGNVHDNFVNYIKNYPYPYVINNSCWEIPCIAPSDWSAQHLHGINNPVTVEDWKAAIDLTVHKQGCFSLVFHPHGWIKPEQVVEMIDHAVAKHGTKVKFLNFRELAERLNQRFFFSTKAMPHAYTIRSARPESVHFHDVDSNGYIDVIYAGGTSKVFDGKLIEDDGSLFFAWESGQWKRHHFPFHILGRDPLALHKPKTGQMVVQHFASFPHGQTSFYEAPEFGRWAHGEGPEPRDSRTWRYGDADPLGLQFDEAARAKGSGGTAAGRISFEMFVDIDADGISEALGRPIDSGNDVRFTFFRQSERSKNEKVVWESTLLRLRGKTPLSELVFVDLDGNGLRDACVVSFGQIKGYLTSSLDQSWTAPLSFGGHIPGILRYPVYVDGEPHVFLGGIGVTNNGFFIHDNHFCWINEDTAMLPDLMYRVSFDDVLAAARADGRASAPNEDVLPEGGKQKANEPDRKVQISNLKSEIQNYPVVPIGAAVVDITPDYPVRLTGYGNRTKESEGAAAKIHARALAIGDSASERAAALRGNATDETPRADAQRLAILITVDNCGVPIEITEAVYDRIKATHNISRECFAVSSTHSHSAPWLRGFAPNIFSEIPEDHAAHLARYEKDLIGKLVEVIEAAIVAQRPGYLSYGFGEVGFAMNRRVLTDGKWTDFGEVPDGPTDNRVPVLAAHDTEGQLIAVLANYACHCTTETGDFNQISGDWAGFAADILEAEHPGAVALIAIGCGADANPSPRGTHEQAKGHGKTMADEVTRILASDRASALRVQEQSESEQNAHGGLTPSAHRISLKRISPYIACNMARINLPLGPLPSRADWESKAKDTGVAGTHARYFLKMLDEGKEIPSTIPDYPVQTWCFGDDLAMVFLGGEVVVDYSIRLNDMFDSDRLWINAYSNDVPCYIASARVLREGGYECDSSMVFYRRPTRLAPEAEDVLCDTVQKLVPHKFYSEKQQEDFPAPKSPEESLKCMTTKPDLRVVLAASEPLIRDPVAFDWDERGRLWVVEMGDYPAGESTSSPLPRRGGEGQGEGAIANDQSAASASSPLIRPAATFSPDLGGEGTNQRSGRVRVLEDTDHDNVYDKATTFLDGLAFPSGIHCWRGGVIVTMAPDIFYAEDTDGDGKADLRETMYKGFVEGNQQHRVNGLRWGLDGWLYLANGDSGGEIAGTGFVPASGRASALRVNAPDDTPRESNKGQHGGLTPSRSPISLRGRDLRIHPDTNGLETVSGQTQFGRERDDFGNWFGNNNSNPIYQYVLEDRYVRRNPHAGISQVTAPVSVIPGAAPVFPTSRTLARFNEFAFANRFTSACSTMIYRDNYLGDQYYGNAFTSEPVHNLVSRLVLKRDGYGFKGERAADEQASEFLASSDNWFRPTMIRTGPDGALWVADMYRAVIEHPEWIPPEYQRKMNLYAGNDRGRIYRIVPAAECCGAKASPLPRAGGEGQGEGAAVNDEKVSSASNPLIRPAATFSPGLGGEGPNLAVTIRRDEPTTAPRDPITPVAESQVAGETNAALADESENSGAHHAKRGAYFDKPWDEIPIADLVKRLESSNGWWRDTAQRILLHRRDETEKHTNAMSRISELGRIAVNPAVRIQSLATLGVIDSTRFNFLPFQALSEAKLPVDQSKTRPVAIVLLEPVLRTHDSEIGRHVRSELESISDDRNRFVRLQLMLSLGEVRGDSAAKQLGRLIRRNFDDPFLRSAGLTSLTPENISGVLKETLNAPGGHLNEELISLLLGQAAAMGRGEVLGEPLTRLVTSINSETPVSRFDLIADAVRKVLRSDAAPALKLHIEFKPALNDAGNAALAVAQDAAADSERRAAALRFADVAGKVDAASQDLNSFLTPQTPTTVQLAAVRILAGSSSPAGIERLIAGLNSFDPSVRAEVLTLLLQREVATSAVLDAVANGTLTESDFDVSQLDGLLNHRNGEIASRAKSMLSGGGVSSRAAVIDDFKSQISNLKSEISNEERIAAGKVVFEKRCGTCHKLQGIGKEVGADLAALKDRSTDALLTAVLDPNRAVESKFLVYTVATKDGLQYSGMLKGETGGSLTLVTNEGKELTVPRADVEELVASKRSLMPEGLEKDLSAQDLMNVFAFVQSTSTPWKRFEGNAPQFVAANADGTVTLPAAAAEIYGPNLVFEQQYGNLGFWSSKEDYAKWTFEVPKTGHWTVEFDFACDDSTAGSPIKLSTGSFMLTARVPGSGSWDRYQTWQAGTLSLQKGRRQIIITAPEDPPLALIDLRAIRLIPPK